MPNSLMLHTFNVYRDRNINTADAGVNINTGRKFGNNAGKLSFPCFLFLL